MSEERIDQLALRLDLLTDQVAQLAEAVRNLAIERTSTSGLSSFQLVGRAHREDDAVSARASSAPSFASNTSIYNTLAKEIPPLPDFVGRNCANLSGGSPSSGASNSSLGGRLVGTVCARREGVKASSNKAI